MSDATIIEPFGVPEIFGDDIDNISIVNGVFRCCIYSLQIIPPSNEPVKVVAMRIAMPVPGAASAARKALAILTVKAIISPQDVFADAERPGLVS